MSITQENPTLFPPESLTPEVRTNVFANNVNAQFWLGMVASENVILLPEEFTASKVLRANVYIDENNFLPDDARRPDGTEVDVDDERSVQFAVVENCLATESLGRVAGTTRLIRKLDRKNLLPVEKLFPEAFPKRAASVNSSEASRFIARHPDRLVQSSIALSLIRAMTLHAQCNDSKRVYAVVENHLARLFTKIGLPYNQLSDLKMVPEYNTENMAISFEPNKILKTVAVDKMGEKIVSLFFDSQAQEAAGLGYFDQSLMTPLHKPQIQLV